MADTQRETVKGVYGYPQMDGFISLKNYIFTWQNDRRCLLLRFVNGFDQEINELEFTLTQLDVHGRTIKSTPITHKRLSVLPGETYTPDRGIRVEDSCIDFKISVDAVRSGDYTYRVVDRQLVAYYPHPEKALLDEGAAKETEEKKIYGFSEQRRAIGHPRLAYIVAALAIFLVVMINAVNAIDPYIGLSEMLWDLLLWGVETVGDLLEYLLDMIENIL